MVKIRRKYNAKSFGRLGSKARQLRLSSVAPKRPYRESSLSSKLWASQLKAVKLSLPHRGFGLFMPMGSGKTWTALRIIEKRHTRGQVDKVGLVVPLHIVEQWIEVIQAVLPDAHITDNPLEPANGRLLFFVCHYDWARNVKRLRLLRSKQADFDMLVVDEGHKLARKDSHQSRRLHLIGKTAMYRLLLTGTPVEGNELDMWAQVRFMDDSIFGEWADFKEEYTRGAGFMGKKRVLKRHKRREYLNKIKRVSYLVSTKEALPDLPPSVDTIVNLSMTGKQLQAYRQMESGMEVHFTGSNWRANADLVVTQLIRLQQLTGGFVTDEDGEYRYFNNVKLDRLSDVMLQHPEPMLIFARWLPEIDMIAQLAEKQKRGILLHTGDYKIPRASFKKSDVVIAQISTMAGLDGLQDYISTGVFFSKTFSRIEYSQARTRLARGGQKEKTHFLHFRCRSSIDVDLDDALSSKGDVEESVIQHLQRRIAR